MRDKFNQSHKASESTDWSMEEKLIINIHNEINNEKNCIGLSLGNRDLPLSARDRDTAREVDSCILTLYVSVCNYRHDSRRK